MATRFAVRTSQAPQAHRKYDTTPSEVRWDETTVRAKGSCGEPHLHFYSHDADVVSRAKDTSAGGLAMAMSFAGGRRLGRCDREGCATVYVDTSRNGRRRFCSLACANRVNVAAHRARHLAG
ncbi:CGNR zinc finger domain-containing protein [Nonomuraea sp. K274]|uniref:CGNR zinc finger domain-containing protein n=1 Tax=Nonomuraea cypriaca TaxID=1187855 RepID=A0A931F672_9ACTN|nr:CGNR zinc finger domain-containing protein [Nonomuraea cypriaca]MBF8192938.1 CGNR zinc finger domain-containing protein [Nonomuraea cypriaca]